MANQRRKIIMQMDNPRLGLKLRSEQLNLEIDAVIETLDLSGFVEAIQTDLQDDVTAVYASHEDFLMARNDLMLALQLPCFPQQNVIVSGGVSESTPSNLGQKPFPSAAIQPIIQSLQPEINSRALPPSTEELQIQLLLKIWLFTSFIPLIVGMLISMAFVVGGLYVPVIAALSPITTGAVFGGLISGIGGVGLGLYCFYNSKLEGLSPDPREDHLRTGMNQTFL